MKLSTLMIRTVRGLEWLACDEIESAGFIVEPASTERTVFACVGQHPAIEAARWQTVDDAFLLLMRVGDFGRLRTEFQRATAEWAQFDWSTAIASAANTLGRDPLRQFSVSASFNKTRNFNRFELEDALGEAIHHSTSLKYISHRNSASASLLPSLRLHLDGKSCSIGLRIREFPLHRREWKVCTAPGTLHPPVAAALSQFLARDRPLRVADPFCGCGTILVELARRSASRHYLLGFDISDAAIKCGAANATAAGVNLMLDTVDVANIPIEDQSIDALITNPPWGKQVEAHDPAELLEHFVREADRLVADSGCLVVLHDWGSTFSERIRRRKFNVLHEQNMRTAGKIARLTIALRKGADSLQPAFDVKRLVSARTRFMTTLGADFIL